MSSGECRLKIVYPPIIAFDHNRWSGNWRPQQQILSRLGQRGWPIVYSPGSPFVWDWQRRDNTQAWWGTFERADGVLVDRPGRAFSRWPRLGPWDELVLGRQARRLSAMAGWARRGGGIIYVYSPSFWPYVEKFSDYRLVYHTQDALSMMPGWTSKIAEMETALVERADLIVTCAKSMARALPGDGPGRANILPNAVDFRTFASGAEAPCPSDLARIPRPRVGYVGVVNMKVDLTLIAQVAARRHDWHWCLVGPIGTGGRGDFSGDSRSTAGWRSCAGCSNIHFLGNKAQRDIPAYMANMDVNAMCYRVDGQGWWKAIDPLKMYEYLAIGKPIVSADLENVRPYADCVEIASGVEGWIGAVGRALANRSRGSKATRQATARCNDWQARVDQLEAWLRDLD